MSKDYKSNDLQVILTQAIDQMKKELGDKFDPGKLNLAELERRTGISRSRLRRYKKDGFIVKPHGRTGRKAEVTVLTGYTGLLDDLLRKNITNASVCFERLREHGYTGGQTQVRVYIKKHQDLIPPKRVLVDPQGNRGRRYHTGPAESYQMDWGFVEACRADINILVSINKAEKTVKLVSFSRGIAIKMTDGPYKGSYEWLTNAQRWAGPIAVMQEFENNFKIKLDRYVRVNFNTVEVVVDAMDGLNLELTEEEVKFFKKNRDWDFEVGMNNLNGWQALQYARLRGVDDDWHRMERQRKCILAVVNQLKGSSFAELNELCDIVLPLVQTNLTKMEIAELILYSPNFLKSEFDQMTIPIPNSYGGMSCFSGVSGWALDYNKNNKALHEFLFGEYNVQ